MGGGAGEIGSAIAAGGEQDEMGTKAMQGTVFEVPCHHAAACAFLVHDQIERKILNEELRVVAQTLLIERVDERMTGPVGGGASTMRRITLAVIGHMAPEWPLPDPAVLGARERHAELLEFDDCGDRIATHVFDRILIAEPVRTFDGVVHVPAPVVRPDIAERSADPALGGNGMATGRE